MVTSFFGVGRSVAIVKFLIFDSFVDVVKFLRVVVFGVAFVMLADFVALIDCSIEDVLFFVRVAANPLPKPPRGSNPPHDLNKSNMFSIVPFASRDVEEKWHPISFGVDTLVINIIIKISNAPNSR